MCSKDLSRIREFEWIDHQVDKGGKIFKQRFLDGLVDMTGNKVALTSYPRAGNSLTRSYLEKITGITTGSEAKSDLTLQLIGLIGEGHSADERVWINKTHFPLAAPFFVNRFDVNKQIYLMRNPLDVIYSVANMVNTFSHELVPNEEYHTEFPEFWDDWINQQISNLATFHNYVSTEMATAMPTHCLRYEDLCENPIDSLRELFEFLLDAEDLKGTVAEARIIQVA